VLLVLLAASALVFVIACSNVANLILARTVRRESELSVRAALGASAGMLRRTLLAESVLLCGTGAVLGVLIARPMVSVLARYASRFSVRALDLQLDASLLWVGVALALVAAVLLAFVPPLPASDATHGFGLSPRGVRITGATNRRLRAFAVTQIAASFVLLAGAGMLLKTLMTLQATRPGFETHNVLAVNVPVVSYGRTPEQIRTFYREVLRRVGAVPGVDRIAVGGTEPRRIVGVVADVDDEHIDPRPTRTVYHPFEQELGGGRLFVHTRTDPYALVPIITKTVRELAADQPVERAATLDEVKADVLAPDRLNTLVFGGFAIVALTISIVGVAGVLAFSVSGRTREFGIRLAVGSQPRSILTRVVAEGAVIAFVGVVVGALGGFVAARALASAIQQIQLPGALPITGAAAVLIGAAVIASVLPAARAARVDVVQALRSE
jgi:hypothetical protein